jgi:hypothetical protein
MPTNPLPAILRRVLLAALLVLSAQTAGALPPQVEADRQLKAAAAEMRQDTIAWQRVLAALTAAEATGTKMPENFDYYMGMALNETGEPAKAMQRLSRYLERVGKRGKSYEAALEQYNVAERRQAQKLEEERRARKAQEDRLAAEARAKQAQEEIARSWERVYFRYWIMDTEGSGSCGDARSRIFRGVQDDAVRGFDCDCTSGNVQHPAWRDHTEDVCRGSFELNRKLDTTANLSEQGRINRWSIRYRSTAYDY